MKARSQLEAEKAARASHALVTNPRVYLTRRRRSGACRRVAAILGLLFWELANLRVVNTVEVMVKDGYRSAIENCVIERTIV